MVSAEFTRIRNEAASCVGRWRYYQLGKAFRRGESGAWHNPEFTLLEWYRTDTSHHELIREVADLVAKVLPVSSWQVWSYAALFAEILNLDVFTASTETLNRKVEEEGISIDVPLLRLDYLDLLMTHIIEPRIAGWGLVFVIDFLPEQAALAKLTTRGENTVAARFEALRWTRVGEWLLGRGSGRGLICPVC